MTNDFFKIFFPVWLRNRIISAGLEPVLSLLPHGFNNNLIIFILTTVEINILSFFLKAVATRNLPLCCVLCKCKILRVKNNYMPANQNGRSSHHSAGLPKSVSGYEVSFRHIEK